MARTPVNAGYVPIVGGEQVDLPRIRDLSPDQFLAGHLGPRQPVVVTGAADHWAARRWTWPGLANRFGAREVDVYDDWFVPTGVMTLSDFVNGPGNGRPRDPKKSYVRWFSRYRPGAGRWSDDVLQELSGDWAQPSFLPVSDYIVPHTPPGTTIDASTDPFPYRGLFLSAAGARTRMHRDPWSSAAALCQLSGQKYVRMYTPDQQEELTDAALRGDPAGDSVPPAQAGTLEPGDVIFIPDGWWHQVDTVSDSVSLTWNFIHRASAPRLLDHVAQAPSDPELSVLSYFLSAHVPGGASATPAELVTAVITRDSSPQIR